MRLTKKAKSAHDEACALLEQRGPLSLVERIFVIEHFHEAGDANNRFPPALFAPFGLAKLFSYDIHGPRVLDLCAGIGVLGLAHVQDRRHGDTLPEIVCVEINPRYVDVGRKVLPEAEWICGDIFDPKIQAQLKGRNFETAFSFPPYGKLPKGGENATPRYRGRFLEYALIDIASEMAADGSFIIPQESSPFLFSGVDRFQECRRPSPNDPFPMASYYNMKRYRPFHEATGISLDVGIGVDTSLFKDDWSWYSPAVEIVTADFLEARHARPSLPSS